MPFIDRKRPQVSPQTVELYKARLTQVDFIKKQQWVVASYAAAIYAALVWVGKNVENISTSLRWFLSIMVALAGAYAIGLLIRFQFDLKKARLRLDDVGAYCFSTKQVDVLKLEFEKDHPEGPFWRGSEVLFALVLVCAVGAIVAVWVLLSLKTAIGWDNLSNPY